MTGPAAIVIAGGYGLVGRHVAELLAPQFPARVIIAGRSRDRAEAAAATVGNGCLAEVLDASDPESVRAVIRSRRPGLVVSCTAGTESALARGCLSAGVDYIDVSADAPGIAAVDRLGPVAVRSGSTAVLSVGVAPGLTNLLAREVCSGLDEVDRLDVGVQLSIGDEHGPAAVDWTLANLAAPFPVLRGRQRGAVHQERPFATLRPLDFGGRARVRAASFNFPEQRSLARTLDVPEVRSWLALQPRSVHVAALVAARTGLARVLGSAALRASLTGAMHGLFRHRDGAFAVCAEASGSRAGRPMCISTALSGHGEATMTAKVAAQVARLLLHDRQSPGVWHIEQLPAAPQLLTAIADRHG